MNSSDNNSALNNTIIKRLSFVALIITALSFFLYIGMFKYTPDIFSSLQQLGSELPIVSVIFIKWHHYFYAVPVLGTIFCLLLISQKLNQYFVLFFSGILICNLLTAVIMFALFLAAFVPTMPMC